MKVLAIILAGGKRKELGSLVKDRSKAAVPFFGKYRVIDFVLSNCLNSGIRKVNVVVQHRFASLQKHIRGAWSIYSSTMGEYIDVYPPQQRKGERFYSGTADSVYQNLFSIEQEDVDYIVALSGDHIYKMDYRKLVEFHVKKGAYLTIASSPVSVSSASSFGIIESTDDNKVVSFKEKPKDTSYLSGDTCLASMGLYVFSTKVLKDIFNSSEKSEKEFQDFALDIIPALLATNKVYTYPFLREDGIRSYWNVLGSLGSYYKGNMDILNGKVDISLYDKSWLFRSFQSQSSPTRVFLHGDGYIVNSAISGGGSIEGRVINSILGTNVTVESGAVIKDSILFDNVSVRRGAQVTRAIIEKEINIPAVVQVSSDSCNKWVNVDCVDDIIVLGKGAVHR